ncbi:hypothetical protein ABBQ32_012116 [Trebouxia sp. C0010 RCD-2024]
MSCAAMVTDLIMLLRYWTRSVEVAACSKHTSKRIVSWQLQGEVVAALMITYEWSDWRNCQLWWIQSVYVHPDHRRKGFFRQLYKYVRQAAEQAQAGGLRLYADTTNEKAHATYEALGMTSHYKVFEDMF